jgi:hypothetical protein
MPLVKTFEEACEHLQLDAAKVIPDFSAYPVRHQAAMTAHGKLVIIAEALNEGWQPDWTNYGQYKYYPWFEMGGPAGVGFSDTHYDHWHSHTFVGSRLCFKTASLAKHAGTQFEELYKDYFTL